jgi:hypothetical protein
MNWEQMQRRCPSSRFFSVGRLPDYAFAIARHSRLRNCGTANIFTRPGSEVWGVVYHLSDEDLTILDGFEDGYRRENVLVLTSTRGDQTIEALAYIAAKEDNAPLPNLEYKKLMVEGARHWQLPQNYLQMLEKIESDAGRILGAD